MAFLPGLLRSVDDGQCSRFIWLRINEIANEFVKYGGVKVQQSNVFLPKFQWSWRHGKGEGLHCAQVVRLPRAWHIRLLVHV
jgi:hypothetical protein